MTAPDDHSASRRLALRARVRGLYAVTPDDLDDALLEQRCAAVLAGGARLLQYRDKSAAPEERTRRAALLRRLTRAHGALLIVNDDAALAAACGADGVHLGRDDGAPAEVRARWPGLLVGVSCYADLDRACLACAAGADYLAFGAVAPSTTKPGAVAAPWSLFSAARPLDLPLVAIGGITLDNAGALRAAGADALAVIGALFDHQDPAAQARAFAARIEEGSRP